jgi:hypothetical protein
VSLQAFLGKVSRSRASLRERPTRSPVAPVKVVPASNW